MNEIELVEAITSHMSIAQVSGNSSIAILFGYLIAAYAVGPSLTTPQVVIGTALYLVSISMSAVGGLSAVNRAVHYATKLQELTPDETIYLTQINPAMAYAVLLASIGGSLWFMWGVRHPKTV